MYPRGEGYALNKYEKALLNDAEVPRPRVELWVHIEEEILRRSGQETSTSGATPAIF